MHSPMIKHHLLKLPPNQNCKRQIEGLHGKLQMKFFAHPDIECRACGSNFEVLREGWDEYRHPKYEKSWDDSTSEYFYLRVIHPALIVLITNALKEGDCCPHCNKNGLVAIPESEFDIEGLCLSFVDEDNSDLEFFDDIDDDGEEDTVVIEKTTGTCAMCGSEHNEDDLQLAPYSMGGDVCDECYEHIAIMS